MNKDIFLNAFSKLADGNLIKISSFISISTLPDLKKNKFLIFLYSNSDALIKENIFKKSSTLGLPNKNGNVSLSLSKKSLVNFPFDPIKKISLLIFNLAKKSVFFILIFKVEG